MKFSRFLNEHHLFTPNKGRRVNKQKHDYNLFTFDISKGLESETKHLWTAYCALMNTEFPFTTQETASSQELLIFVIYTIRLIMNVH